MDDGSGFVRYLTNEELGIHNNKPIILLIDEYGKANAAVKNALTPTDAGTSARILQAAP
jgi:hypothetical protein